MRLKAVAVVIGSLLALAGAPANVVSPTRADVGPRIPTNAADWAGFSLADRQRAIDHERHILEALLASGKAQVRSAAAPATSTSVAPLVVSVTNNCPIQWINLADGTWTRGGGWTDASTTMYQIYAGQVGTYAGRFYRDGVQIKTWYQYLLGVGASHAENWTDYDWKWWFESPQYFNAGYHGAQQYNGGSWQLGPNKYCTVSARP